MSNENEEKLTPFQLARRNFMNQGNNASSTQPDKFQRPKTISGTATSKLNQENNPTPSPQQNQDSEENLTPFQLARRRFNANSQTNEQLQSKKTFSAGSATSQPNQPPKQPNPVSLNQNQQQPTAKPQSLQNQPPLIPGQPLSQQQKPIQPAQPQLPQHQNQMKPGQPVIQPQPIQTAQPPAAQPKPPVTKPEQPISPPEPPVAQPKQPEPPVSQPEQPVVQPERPVAQQEPPAAQLEPPVAQPEQIAAQSVPNTAQSEKPVSQPEPPTSQQEPTATQPQPPTSQPESSAIQTIHSETPVTQQEQPAAQSIIQPPPIQPATQPIQPTAQPIQPAVQPIQPAVQPIQPVAQPIQPSAQPNNSDQPIAFPHQSFAATQTFKIHDLRSNTPSSPSDPKSRSKVGIFKKKRPSTSRSLSISSPIQVEDETQGDSNIARELMHVESVIKVFSVPSTAASSKDFLKVPDITSSNGIDLYDIRKIKLETYPTSYRFFSLMPAELNCLPWLNYLKDRPTNNFIFPGEFAQTQPIEMECHSEFDLEDFEPENESITPNNFLSDFDNPSSAEFKSNPFIDLNARSVINSISFPFVREESRMGFFHLKNICMDQASAERFGMQLNIHAFVYTDKVITEIFLIKMSKDFTSCQGFLSSMNAPNGTESIIIPYPLNQPAYLVLSLMLDESSCEESPGSSFAFSKYLLPKDKLPEKIEFEFVAGMANQKLVEILKEKPNIPLKFIGEAELVEAPVPCSTLRLTAYSNMTPTPVFSIYDISIKMNLKISSSKDKICFSVKIKKLIPDNKNPEPREVCGFLDFKTGKMVDIAYSGLRDYSENICFQEPINFIFDSNMIDPIEITLTTYTLKKKKLNPIMVSKFQIKNSEQRHVNKMEVKGSLIADMKSAFSKQDNMLSCSTLYPALVCPNASLRSAFSNPINDPILSDPMFKNIAPYLIQKFLDIQNLPRASFYELFECIRMSNMSEIQNWIDHFFYPEPGFTSLFISRLVDSLDIIKDWPQPFFSLAFKGICSENKLSEVEQLLDAIVTCKHETIKKSAGDLLLQIPMYFDIKESHRITIKFISKLNTADRFYIFKYIFSDILYVESLTIMDFQIEGKKPRSPYVPLLSLFYSTITNGFVENNADSVGAVSFTLSVLATTLETYLDYNNARHVAKILFPLISIIFTFYDSLSEKLEKKNSLLPILLFIMKYSDKYQFMQYYQLLSSDNKPRFFEFLRILFDNSMVNTSPDEDGQESIVKSIETPIIVDKHKHLKMTDVARNTFFFNDHPLNCVYEITCRFMVFLSHFESDVNCDEQIQISIITLLLHMLIPLNQPSESYGMIYKTLSNFIKIFIESVYLKETGLINQLFTTIIPLTQRKLLYVRMQSIGFIQWLMEKEKNYRQSMNRCNLALQYAVCGSVFDLNQVYCYPFWKFLPSTGANIQTLYETLVESISDPLIEKKITKLLDLLNKEYSNFPSIRGRIYLKIIDINIQANNMFSAFVTQWKYCGFLAEVFKLQNVVIPGIPRNGYKDFPFIVDEPPIDLSVFPKDSAYLVTKSDLFTPDSIESAFIKAFNLAMKASFYWLIGDITQFIFDYLECKRKYLILNDLYNQIPLSYQKLQENENPRIEFARIFVKGKLVEKFGFSDAIHPLPLNGFASYPKELFKLLEDKVELGIEPYFDSKQQSYCQIVQVYPVLEELLGLNATTFTCDVFESSYKNWNDIMAKRYTFKTETPLPSTNPTVKVSSHEVKEITKKDYYIDQLTKLKVDFYNNTQSMKSVIPPSDMIDKWKQYMSGLSPKNLMNLMRKVFGGNDKNSNIYNIIVTLEKYDPSFAFTPLDPNLINAPVEVLELCDDIWKLMIEAVPVIDTLFYLCNDPEAEKLKAEFLKYRRDLGVPLVAI